MFLAVTRQISEYGVTMTTILILEEGIFELELVKTSSIT